MKEIIETLYEMEGICKDTASKRAENIFRALDINCDGELEEDEFIRGCLDDDDLINLLNAGGMDPEEELE